MEKKVSRRRRATKARAKMKELKAVRLCVNKTNQHIYAQLIENAPQGDKILASASTLDKEVQSAGGKSANVHSAGLVGNIIAKRALANGIQKIAFDRSGFKYHGCIEALAQAARESGLQF